MAHSQLYVFIRIEKKILLMLILLFITMNAISDSFDEIQMLFKKYPKRHIVDYVMNACDEITIRSKWGYVPYRKTKPPNLKYVNPATLSQDMEKCGIDLKDMIATFEQMKQPEKITVKKSEKIDVKERDKSKLEDELRSDCYRLFEDMEECNDLGKYGGGCDIPRDTKERAIAALKWCEQRGFNIKR
ncbi:MAG: hypothetical protein EP297_08910 [Gammaproteobacteria bacterium]|nr:MAG: hypothetical protein EP297_08910 [Gammaproteobacteria bacterium]